MKNKKKILYIQRNNSDKVLVTDALDPAQYRTEKQSYNYLFQHKAVFSKPDLILVKIDSFPLDFKAVSCFSIALTDYKDVPIVAVTPKGTETEKRTVLAMGCSGYIEETIFANQLNDSVDNYLKGNTITIDKNEENRYLKEINAILVKKIFDFEKESIDEHGAETESMLTTLNQKLLDAQEQLAQKEKLAIMGELVAGLAHEIKNPLTAINGFLAVIARQVTSLNNYRLNAALDGIKLALDHLNSLVNNFVDFSRKTKDNFVEIDMTEVINKVLSLAEPKLKDDNILLVTEVQEALPNIKGSSNQLIQVFLNLIINALYAMDKGGQLAIRCRSVENNKYIEIQVSDNGKGIAPEHIDKIFEAFFTTKDISEGAGLGLSISYGIIERHKGFIDVKSEVGKGTTFIIKLPTIYNT
ncbi:MAG: hypothetical protein DKM50_10935 [Candidatus Margulisiibacteriota bacterium]|nr:MAG: hypothetical protein A2X43_07745 [Candidatus Margulisbacteria bacterium GWD2_39_127]OGI03884.1 MAG: hypothetical protein A2X42_09990 [Candidatus Margulisbacteria bacterium GWF2_38_17]OGI08811.1 MAG: hypothetical protein A2X41_05125 [Candidatus Margulisbacteria bacterium GWE2_39_32]PZM78642.1 MAG: hypothetical protein DKM50_10935 [Candidatus Margulisiibacteriota bacterium]HAR61983.1 hypothetical protein [Candidatus Margulisiibacteriota bacterium]